MFKYPTSTEGYDAFFKELTGRESVLTQEAKLEVIENMNKLTKEIEDQLQV